MMIFSLNGNVIMTYSTLDEKYKRFFNSGQSLYSRSNTNYKTEFIKNGFDISNTCDINLLIKYMDNDIVINYWS